MSEQCPVTITAKQFVKGDYAEKIARGECVVKAVDYPQETIISLETIKPNSAGWDILITDTKSVYRTFSDVKLTVTWLPQPEREEAAAREFADGWRDAEVARLQAEVARLREALESINSMVLDMPIKTGDKDAILDVVSAALAEATASEPDHK